MVIYGRTILQFEYPLDLHYSQTFDFFTTTYVSLNTLWIYTTLKHAIKFTDNSLRLNTLWIYTTLKHLIDQLRSSTGLNTLWIYTTLKPYTCDIRFMIVWIPSGFTLLSNLGIERRERNVVWIPSGFTLLSNYQRGITQFKRVWIPSGFTLLSNLNRRQQQFYEFEYPLDLHYSQTY